MEEQWEKEFDIKFVDYHGEKVEPTFRDAIGDVGPVKAFIRTQRIAAERELLETILREDVEGQNIIRVVPQ
jgi:hypothetical protein